MQLLTVQKRKRPSGCGRWRGYDLGADDLGHWVFTPAHSTFLSDDGHGRTASCEVAQDAAGRGRDSVLLLPVGGWFVACFVLDALYTVTVDISTPPEQADSTWSFDDLELDPFLIGDTYGVEDEDEFVAACRAGLIDETERTAALSTVQSLEVELTRPGSPLTSRGRQRLHAGIRLDLPPLLQR